MSLFIASLAFADPALLSQAKIGVLAASLIAALAGLAVLSRALPQRPSASPALTAREPIDGRLVGGLAPGLPEVIFG